MLTFIVYLVRKSLTKKSMLEVAGLTLRHTGVVHSLVVAIVFSDTFSLLSNVNFLHSRCISVVLYQRHYCVSVLQLTQRDGQKEREATRGVDMQLQEAPIQQDAQIEAHIRCYVRQGDEVT